MTDFIAIREVGCRMGYLYLIISYSSFKKFLKMVTKDQPYLNTKEEK